MKKRMLSVLYRGIRFVLQQMNYLPVKRKIIIKNLSFTTGVAEERFLNFTI